MKNEALIKTLNTCADACNHCADACLDEDNIGHMIDCIRTDRVCADVCSSTAKILSMSYGPIDELLRFCVSVCTRCAEECSQHDHEHCQECARACTACKEACQNILTG
ncbi:four-helix bundle copper-binding protein [Cyclobacterium amurskyense]|uniref:Ferredoxin n=1 Tax=Cyclobacterium amurskyense TaxID=320787 RepID=A0A0H4PE52_9BACT|nr:four-helix bundle copper-binding protein [Cyclobacterium amurskyense]AKP52519.1 hypothetical protein CA2015_3119 [Cyclobacterium amurskyense]